MAKEKVSERSFFILYGSGHVIYINYDSKYGFLCRQFNVVASQIQITNDDLKLCEKDGTEVYSLSKHNQNISNDLKTFDRLRNMDKIDSLKDLGTLKRLANLYLRDQLEVISGPILDVGIDLDIKDVLLAEGKIVIEDGLVVPGLNCENKTFNRKK